MRDGVGSPHVGTPHDRETLQRVADKKKRAMLRSLCRFCARSLARGGNGFAPVESVEILLELRCGQRLLLQ
jgi:hypothetical protein